MYLADSNIIIYSSLEQYAYLRDFLVNEPIFVSEISRIEVLGYHKITAEEETYFKDIFRLIPIIVPSQQIFDEAIAIRKKHNLSLGDSIIAATAFVHNLSIYTRNLSDFEKVIGVNSVNPVHK
jgi:predicted nucleic acid-binding protein